MGMGDIYEVTVKHSMKGQALANVFHYRQNAVFATTSLNTATVLGDLFWSKVGSQWTQVVTADVRFNSLVARNLFVESDYYELVIDEAGSNGGGTAVQSLPVFNAISASLVHDGGASIKKGAKRLAGIPEAAVDDGLLSDTDYINGVDLLLQKFAEPIAVGTIIFDDVFFPVTVQRVKEIVNGVAKYRLPANIAEAVYATILDAVFGLEIGSQVSRKIRLG